MDLSHYVSSLGSEFASLAGVAGEDAQALVERLTGPLESAIRMTLMDALSAAADEISRELAPGSVDVRLRGRDPVFAVTPPPADPGALAAARSAAALDDAPDNDLLIAEDGPVTRINVRMPEQLKAAVEEAAAREGRSVNAWLVRAAATAVQRSDRDPRSEPPGGGKRGRQGVTGWVR